MNRLQPDTTVLVVVDVQERLAAAMPKDALARLVANAAVLLEAARVLRVPVLATEQYSKGLGPTLPELGEKLRAMGVSPIEKLDFDAAGEPRFARALGVLAPRACVVIGMEAHVCVFQTARELVRRGYETHVVGDAVASRREENRVVGMGLAERAGAVGTVTEAVVFDWLGRAGTEEFKVVSRLMR